MGCCRVPATSATGGPLIVGDIKRPTVAAFDARYAAAAVGVRVEIAVVDNLQNLRLLS